MSALDASFLFGEDGNSHMDIGMVLEFEGPAVSRDDLADAISGRLPLVPRYRQKVRLVPAAAALPVWVDDVQFDVRRHIFETPASPAGDDAALFDAVSRVMSNQLDRDKPLWEAHLITGLADDRWALVVRMHHCMVDGISSTAIVGVLLTSDPDPAMPERLDDAWSPQPEPSDAQLLQDAFTDNLKAAGELVKATAAAALKPPSSWSTSMPKTMDLEPLRQVGQPPLDPTLTGPVGPGRRFQRTRIELDDVRRVRSALGGTVNDVIMAITARAFRALLLRRGELVSGRSVRALMPVALKVAEGTGAEGGNRISGVPVELPVGEVSAVECLDRIRAQTSVLKALGEAMPANAQVEAPGFGLPVLLALSSRLAGTVPTFFHTVASNVPGPREPLFLSGRRLTGLSACISLWSPLRIAVQVLSYTGVLSFAAVADSDNVPDLSWFVEGAEDGMRELLQAAEAVEA